MNLGKKEMFFEYLAKLTFGRTCFHVSCNLISNLGFELKIFEVFCAILRTSMLVNGILL